ncbi:MAG: RNA polymerase sigma factor [Bacteroidota bacterium]
MSEYTDKELLDLLHNGDNPHYAFNLLVRKYQRKLYHTIRRIIIDHDDTNDVLQNTFIKAWNGIKNFREESQLFTWLYRIATNESITFLNKQKRNLHQSIEDHFNSISTGEHGETTEGGKEIQEKLQKAILTLPEKQRIVFNMKYYDEMKYEDMAVVLETSVGALKASYHHAVKKIEDYLTSR